MCRSRSRVLLVLFDEGMYDVGSGRLRWGQSAVHPTVDERVQRAQGQLCERDERSPPNVAPDYSLMCMSPSEECCMDGDPFELPNLDDGEAHGSACCGLRSGGVGQQGAAASSLLTSLDSLSSVDVAACHFCGRQGVLPGSPILRREAESCEEEERRRVPSIPRSIPSGMQHVPQPGSTTECRQRPSDHQLTSSVPMVMEGCWSSTRSGNVRLYSSGTVCVADASAAVDALLRDCEAMSSVPKQISIPMFAIGSLGVLDGCSHFSVSCDPPRGGNSGVGRTAVGVCTEGFCPVTLSGALLLWTDGSLSDATPLGAAVSQQEFAPPISFPCRITIHINRIRREISFSLNGVLLGVAFRLHEGVGVLLPVVVFTTEETSATIHAGQ